MKPLTIGPLTIGLVAWAMLVLLQPAWYCWLAPPANGKPEFALIFMLPALLLPLFALRRGARRALLWVGIIALFYFCHGIVAAWTTPAARVPAVIEALLCVILIGMLGLDARLAKRSTASR